MGRTGIPLLGACGDDDEGPRLDAADDDAMGDAALASDSGSDAARDAGSTMDAATSDADGAADATLGDASGGDAASPPDGSSDAGSAPGSYVHVYAGNLVSCAITTTGDAVCWGDARWGQLDVPEGPFVHLAVGGQHVSVVASAGRSPP
ncbi:MAG: hypothetical protein IT379_16090 [Deltaproteobacteria bacterium]|nr:hypothetical protein [Deltaproteobacteria bacterium]